MARAPSNGMRKCFANEFQTADDLAREPYRNQFFAPVVFIGALKSAASRP